MTETSTELSFKKSSLGDASTGNKKRMWKSLKQILATERTSQWPDNAVTCKQFQCSTPNSTFILNCIFLFYFFSCTQMQR